MADTVTISPWASDKQAFRQGYHHGYAAAADLMKLLAASLSRQYDEADDMHMARAADEVCRVLFAHHTTCTACLGREASTAPDEAE